MQGLIIYEDKEEKEQKCYFSGAKFTDEPEDILKQHNKEFKKILSMYTED